MNRTMEFSFKRFMLLIRNDIYVNRVIILMASAAISLLIIIFLFPFLWSEQYKEAADNINIIYPRILYIFGLIITVNIFKDIHNEVNCPVRLLLPASILEKYASRVLLSTMLFAVGLTALISAVSLIYAGIIRLLFGSCIAFFNPFSKRILFHVVFYFMCQAPFILGAVYFKKSFFIKTFLCFGIFAVLLWKFCSFMGDYYVYILYSGIFFTPDTYNPLPVIGPIGNTFKWAVHIYLCYFFILSCWITGFIRLKEKEI